MKPFIGLAGICLLIACNNQEEKAPMDMAGAYHMTSGTIKGGSTDTTFGNTDQMKIYTNDFMMFASVNPPDSISNFGVSSYVISHDTLTENVVWASRDTTVAESAVYALLITPRDNGYQQVIEGITMVNGDTVILTENYDKVGTNTTSPFDGVWRQTDRYVVTGTDTISTPSTQFKAYYGGNVIWGHTWVDSIGGHHTGVGFGTFTVSGDTVKENMKESTYYPVRNQSFDVVTEMIGTDGYKQTITNPDGSKAVEIYERLKK